MNFITIDTVLNKTYLGVYLNGETVAKTIESDEKNYHSAYLIRVLYDLLNERKLKMSDFDYLGANIGTGSFTGIRTGLSVVKTMASRLNIKTVPYTTAEILSRAYNNKNIMLDARRNSVFYSKDGINTNLISYDETLEILNSNESYITDNNLIKNEKFAQFKNRFISYEENGKDLTAAEIEIVKEKIEKGETLEYYEIKPLYVQTPPVFIKS